MKNGKMRKTDKQILETPIIDLNNEERERLRKLMKDSGVPLYIID